MKQKQIPLTQGPILKSLTSLALPIMASSFLGTIYSITDMAWIGLLGAKAVAGVGVGGMYVWLSQSILPRSQPTRTSALQSTPDRSLRCWAKTAPEKARS